MGAKKRSEGFSSDVGDAAYDKGMDEFAVVVAESTVEHYEGDLEPFEDYVSMVKGKIYQDKTVFRTNFNRGYRILLEELHKDGPSSE